MKVKAVIMRPDRTNDVVVMRPRHLKGKTFRHNNCMYFLHPDRFQITQIRRAGFKVYHITYYFIQGVSNPLPVPDFGMMIKKQEKVLVRPVGENGTETVLQIEGEPVPEGEYNVADFKDAVNLGVPAEELASLFNPWFYRVIAPVELTWQEKLRFLLDVGTALGVGYCIYLLSKLSGA